MERVLVVGGGVVGTMHARQALLLGHSVIQVEADAAPRRASVRNFGLVWISGRAAGPELSLALRAREIWASIGRDVPGVGFRSDGSLTIAQAPEELAVLEAVAAADDAGARGVRMLDPATTRALNPAVKGELLGALLCTQDGVVEPGRVLPELRASFAATGRYEFRPSTSIADVGPGWAEDSRGNRFDADLVVICPGSRHEGVAASMLADAPLRRCRLQMMQTAPHPERLTTSLADGDSLRYYPVFARFPLEKLRPPSPLVTEHRIQLLVSQRATGELTIGDTHAYDEPFDFAVEEEPYEHLRSRVESLLGGPLPPVQRRWAGVYSQATDDRVCVRVSPAPGVVVVTGLGGRGMTLSPAVAEQTFAELGP
ncbi:MAG: dependent oxidoreductase [Actinomycetia bacterium]|nr:dependent oxidoreductase [Actinomycetes bacterium]